MFEHFNWPRVTRRSLLTTAAALGATTLAGGRWAIAGAPALTVGSRTLEVNRKAAKVFSVIGPTGASGLMAKEGDRLTGALQNASAEPLQMHWHGQIKAPFDQDRARPGGGTLAPGQSDVHDFELTPGTHWMHSHSLSEQKLLAAPMVALETDAGDMQQIVVMLHDFAFRSPEEILAELRASQMSGGGMMDGMHSMGGQMMGMGMMGPTHANDVSYDAYLANDRSLDDPEVVPVDKGELVRLRIINGGTATAFFISTPGLQSHCVAVDGSACAPVVASSYPLAQGQRIDLVVSIPASGGAFPVIAQVEADRFLTGIVLATAGAEVRKLQATAEKPEAFVDLSFESRLKAARPLEAKPADRSFMAMLGEDAGYSWTINGRTHGEHEAFSVRQGERIEITFMNPTSMMHPMHLHGHHFQVVAVGHSPLAGAVRDTVIVPPHMPVTIAFDAVQKGQWFLHCHHLYHMASGMMTEVRIT